MESVLEQTTPRLELMNAGSNLKLPEPPLCAV